LSLRAFLSRLTLRRQVVSATVLILAAMVGIATWAVRRVYVERENELSSEASSVATTAEATLSQYLRGLDSLGAVLSAYPAVRALDADGTGALFSTVLSDQPTLLNVMIMDREGTVRASAIPAAVGRTSPVPPYARQVFDTGRPTISGFLIDSTSGKPTVVLGYPIVDAPGHVVGVLGIDVNLVALGRVFAIVPLPNGSVMTLTDREGRVLARTLEPEKYVGQMIRSGAADPSRVPRTADLAGMEGVPRIFANVPIARGPWLLSVGIPQHEAFARAVPQWRRNAVIGLTYLFVTFLFTFLMTLAVSRLLAQLTNTARRIADGDLSPPASAETYSLDATELHRAFVAMAANLREARDTLDRRIEEERRMREMLQSLQRQVVRQERLAAVGLLVSGVAHELNNPLQAILGTAELLERVPGLGPAALEEVAFVKTQSGRARDIIRNLSRFSSQQSGPTELIDLRDVVGEVIQLRRGDLDIANISLDVELSSTRKVYANFTEIEQVALNFVINAQQSIEAAGRQNGRVLIRLFDLGKRVHLEVQDNGAGVHPEDEPKLFQPFFTTKPVGKGTGLGLSVSYGIIDSHGGSIGYRGNDWGGATFFFELPAADAASTSQADDRSSLLHRSV